jgi:nucleoside-diphosphate-sugar epimerase
MNRKLVITGASGFVGKALASKLQCHGERVLGICRSGEDLCFPVTKLASFGDTGALRKLLHDAEVVVHCAARVHVMQDKAADPLAAFREVNRDLTLELARLAAASGVKRFVFLSSVTVNGKSTSSNSPFRSDDNTFPDGPSGISKLEAERGLQRISLETGLEVVIIRPPLVYGPGMKGNFASISKLVKKGLPLPLGAIYNKRSLVGLDNLIDLIITCIDHPAATNQVFLVSDGDDLSTTELFRSVAEAMGKSSRLIPVPASWLQFCATHFGKKAVAQRLLGSLQVDISHTQKCLNWTPPLTVKQGLQRCFPNQQD